MRRLLAEYGYGLPGLGFRHDSAGAMMASKKLGADSHVEHFQYDAWPESETGDVEMQFRLIYQGVLPAASKRQNRCAEKHHIRKAIHKQLSQLWSTQPDLEQAKHWVYQGKQHYIEMVADGYARCGFRFLPLIGRTFGSVACSLDILFLRRDQPGNLIKHGGDIDNRIKVLFDALKMPERCDELDGSSPDADENPFYCLLEDDRLITDVKITTDRLLTPFSPGEQLHDVYLVIRVKTLVTGELENGVPRSFINALLS